MPNRITIDFESRSACDLKKCGAWVYSEHPTTEVLMLAFCSRNGGVFMWYPGDPEPPFLRSEIEAGTVFECHNAAFERSIWANIMVPVFGWPEIPEDQWYDSMAVCARRHLPLSLESAADILHLPVKKDSEGAQALKRLMKPVVVKRGKAKEFLEDPELLKTVAEYCATDTRAQMHLARRLGDLEPQEVEVWRLNQRMNMRGLGIDLEFAADCQAIVDQAREPLARQWEELVGCKPKAAVKVRDWMHEHGAAMPGLGKEIVEEWLKKDDLPDAVRTALELRGALTSSAVDKLASMRNCTGTDGRARWLLQYHGAGTGRDAGRLLQPQNFPRGTVEFGKDLDGNDVPAWEVLVPYIQTRDAAFIGAEMAHMEKQISEEYRHLTAPVSAVTSALRHCLVPSPGSLLVCGDFSTIEVRVLLAIAGQTDKLGMIANGVDPYCDMAEKIYGYEVRKKDHPAERQDGKAAVLGLGFQMGVDKFWRKDFKGRDRSLVERIVEVYRTEWAPEVPKLWDGLQEAATRCVWDRRPTEFNGIEYRIEDEWLTCRLPSGRKLFYLRPKAVRREMPWSTDQRPDIRQAWTYLKPRGRGFLTVDAYGGMLTENVVQATARDLLYDALLRVDAEGYPVIMAVHDEGIIEVPEELATQWGCFEASPVREIMETPPDWGKALGIPIATEGWIGDRYRK